jgi:F-box protein, helicase, 18
MKIVNQVLIPTTEQQAIIEATKELKDQECLKISAFAGTAKTTTLKMIAEQMPDTMFLYLAFNKAIVDECKGVFPRNVEIRTIHSLAYGYVVKERQDCKVHVTNCL